MNKDIPNPKIEFLYPDPDEDCLVPVSKDDGGSFCSYYLLKEGIFKKAAGYISMKLDLVDCIAGIELLQKIKDDIQLPQIVKTSLLFTSIFKYARCFTEGEDRGTQLNVKLFKGLSKEVKNFHERTMALRHLYLAHAHKSSHETRAMVITLNQDYSIKLPKEIRAVMYRQMDDDANLQYYIELFRLVESHVERKISESSLPMQKAADKISFGDLQAKGRTPIDSYVHSVKEIWTEELKN